MNIFSDLINSNVRHSDQAFLIKHLVRWMATTPVQVLSADAKKASTAMRTAIVPSLIVTQTANGIYYSRFCPIKVRVYAVPSKSRNEVLVSDIDAAVRDYVSQAMLSQGVLETYIFSQTYVSEPVYLAYGYYTPPPGFNSNIFQYRASHYQQKINAAAAVADAFGRVWTDSQNTRINAFLSMAYAKADEKDVLNSAYSYAFTDVLSLLDAWTEKDMRAYAHAACIARMGVAGHFDASLVSSLEFADPSRDLLKMRAQLSKLHDLYLGKGL